VKTVHGLRFGVYSTPNPLNGRAGFTLTELLISISITALVIAAAYASFITQQRAFMVQDQAAETLVSSRIAFDMIVNDIRNAGFGYPGKENLPPGGINGFTDVITIDNALGPNGSDRITILGGFRKIADLQNAVVTGSNQINIKNYTSTNFNLTNRSNLSIDGIQFAKIESCTLIGTGAQAYCSLAQPLILDRSVSVPFPANRPVYLVEDVTYQIEGGNLQRVRWLNTSKIYIGTNSDTDTIANNIDDLQFAGIPSTGVINSIRVNLLARTQNEDPTLEPSTKPYFATGITLEDNTTPDTDQYRRRIWSMEVALRNPR